MINSYPASILISSVGARIVGNSKCKPLRAKTTAQELGKRKTGKFVFLENKVSYLLFSNSNAILVADLTISLSTMDKETSDLKNTLYLMDLTDTEYI